MRGAKRLRCLGIMSKAGFGNKAEVFNDGDPASATGDYSHVEGYDTKTTGNYSHVEGNRTTASGDTSHAEGNGTTASGNISHAEGYEVNATGKASHAEGTITTASGDSSHSEGFETTASGDSSHAEGYGTKVTGDRGHAEGDHTEAGWRSHAEGFYTLANATSHAGGRLSKATGKCSFAHGIERYEDVRVSGTRVITTTPVSLDDVTITVDKSVSGILNIGDLVILNGNSGKAKPTDVRKVVGVSSDGKTITIDHPFGDANYTTPLEETCYISRALACEASGDASHAEGYCVAASGHYSHAEGWNTTASGDASHAEGRNTTASGYYSHAEGFNTIASGDYSHAEGNETETRGADSHAEGLKTKTYSTAGHSEGCGTQAGVTPSSPEVSGDTSCAHAEGNGTKAFAFSAHAEGNNAVAAGSVSHAEGRGTEAWSANQHVQGRWNAKESNDKLAHIVGNGTSKTDRRNAHTVAWTGDAWFAGDVYVGGTSQGLPGTDPGFAGAEKLVRMSDVQPKIVATAKPIMEEGNAGPRFEVDVELQPGKNYRFTFAYDTVGLVTHFSPRSTSGDYSYSTPVCIWLDGGWKQLFFNCYSGSGTSALELMGSPFNQDAFSLLGPMTIEELPF